MVMRRSTVASSGCLLVALYCSGCSFHYVDRNGFDRYVGFISMRTKQHDCVQVTAVESFGIALDATPESRGVTVGYRATTTLAIEGNVSVEVEGNGDGDGSGFRTMRQMYLVSPCVAESPPVSTTP